MKKVLIVIHDMRIGGAQKSLVSFLKCLTESSVGKSYDISLMVIDPTGPFMKEIPEGITLLQPPKPLRWLGSAVSKELLLKHFSWSSLLGECRWLLRKKHLPKELNLQQKLWYSWKSRIPKLKNAYDVAVSYIDGVPNYYVTDCVTAAKKVLWVHNDYEKLKYQPTYDRPYYSAADGIVTISEECRKSLARAFPEQESRLHILENITVAWEVLQKAQKDSCPEFTQFHDLKLLSVGRLNPQKGFDMAISAAEALKRQGISFLWLVLGEGPERQQLQQQIDRCGVADCFRLLGVRENPYPYMKQCDILVQSSRMEGKSIVMDEAKLLGKAAVVTNYSTVRDSVVHGKTGLIVDMTADALADGILSLYRNAALRKQLETYLQTLPKGNEEELMQYCEIML